MTQNKTTLKVIILSVTAGFLFSCSPKAAGVRGQVKTGQTNLDPSISAQSNQIAAQQGNLYEIRSVTLPKAATSGGWDIDVVLSTPNNDSISLTTHHDSANLSTEGTFPDKARDLIVKAQSRCSSDNCEKYILLVTVLKNNAADFQTGAISFKSDCNFFSISIGRTVANLFTSLDQFNSKYNPTPANNAKDGESCQ